MDMIQIWSDNSYTCQKRSCLLMPVSGLVDVVNLFRSNYYYFKIISKRVTKDIIYLKQLTVDFAIWESTHDFAVSYIPVNFIIKL